MAYLHNEPNVIVHRDLKPRNVLLVNPNADHLKVGDFGLSKLIRVQNSHDIYKMTGETGSYRYMAPEVFKHRKYDKKVDVFSFAMILYEMLEGEPPLSGLEAYEAAKHVAEGHRPHFRAKSYTPELKDRMLERTRKISLKSFTNDTPSRPNDSVFNDNETDTLGYMYIEVTNDSYSSVVCEVTVVCSQTYIFESTTRYKTIQNYVQNIITR